MTDWFATIVRKPKDLQLKDYFRGNVALVEVDACTIEGEHKFLPSAVSLPWLQDCLFRAWMRVVCMMHVKSKWQVDHGRLRWARVGRDSCEFRYMLLGHLLFSSSKRISNKNVRTAFLLSYCCRWTHYDNWQDSLWSHARFSSSTTYRSPMISLSLFLLWKKGECFPCLLSKKQAHTNVWSLTMYVFEARPPKLLRSKLFTTWSKYKMELVR